ncbi:MAG: hypothetical protein RR049_06910, partial [Angelakisella sp.]
GTFSMAGGEISGNYAPKAGAWGAICANSGTLNLGGTAKVYGNFTGEVEQNIYLGGSTVKMTSAPITGANLRITSARPYTGLQVVTNAVNSGSTDNVDYSQYFKYDGNAYAIRSNADKHLVLATAGEVYVGSKGDDANPGTFEKPYKTLKKAYSVAGVGVTTVIMVVDSFTDTDDFVMNQDKTVVLTSCTATGAASTGADIHTVRAGGSGNHFTLRGNAKASVKNLTIADSNTGRTGRLFIANDGGAPELTLDTGTTLQNGKSQYSGGAIYWRSGKLNIKNNAKISNCQAKGGGGAIWIDGGEVILDGAITGNNSDKDGGGGVCYNGGKLTLGTNAQITGNTRGTAANNLYIKNGKVVNVSAAPAAGKIGITTEAIPAAGGAGVLIANGTTTTNSFVSDVESAKMKFEAGTNGATTVLLKRMNSNNNLSMGYTMPGESI